MPLRKYQRIMTYYDTALAPRYSRDTSLRTHIMSWGYTMIAVSFGNLMFPPLQAPRPPKLTGVLMAMHCAMHREPTQMPTNAKQSVILTKHLRRRADHSSVLVNTACM
eukprot:1863945-Amphidinium_carterae.1